MMLKEVGAKETEEVCDKGPKEDYNSEEFSRDIPPPANSTLQALHLLHI